MEKEKKMILTIKKEWFDMILKGEKNMKNKELFDRVNATNDVELKAKLRNAFLDWCQENGRTPMNTQSTLDWRELESIE